jgi:hypothetical protein
MVAGTISLRSQRFFSPFPRGTGSLSVTEEYLALRRGRRSFTRSFTCIALLRNPLAPSSFRLRGCHPLWRTVPGASPNLPDTVCGPTTPGGKPPGLGWSAFARHYLRNRIRFLFLRLLRCFTSAGVAIGPDMNRARLPYSEIPGSSRMCRSPRLIAAYHVLHRLSVPRHSPCALCSLI